MVEAAKEKMKKSAPAPEKAAPLPSPTTPSPGIPDKKEEAKKEQKEQQGGPKVVAPEQKFEPIDFVVRHFRISNWTDFKELTYTAEEIGTLLDGVAEVMKAEKTLCKMSGPVTIVGDINGRFKDLVRILNIKSTPVNEKNNNNAPPPPPRQVFATERQLIYNNRYILLRGHQEMCILNDCSSFKKQLACRFPFDYEWLWTKLQTAYGYMPIAALIGEKILCVHSGISHEIQKSVMEIRSIPKPAAVQQVSSLVRDLIFSCPLEDDKEGAEAKLPLFLTSGKKAYVPRFNEASVKQFCTKTGIELIVRSHENCNSGFRFFSGKRMLTIFSTPRYRAATNRAAILKVSGDGKVTIIQLRLVTKAEEDRRKAMKNPTKSVEKGGEAKKKEEKMENQALKSRDKSSETKKKKSKRSEKKSKRSEKKKSEKKVPEAKKSEQKLEKKKEKSEKKLEKKKEKSKKSEGKKAKGKTPKALSRKNSKEFESVFDNISERGPSVSTTNL